MNYASTAGRTLGNFRACRCAIPKIACDPKADVSFRLIHKLRDQQPSSQVHFFYRLRREHVAAECTLALHDEGTNMKWLFALSLALVLAACAESGNFDREKPIKLAMPAQPTPAPTSPAPHKPVSAKAQASRAEANEVTNNSSLMECGSEACKIQCSPALKKDARPKWCMYFREPVDRHASEIQGSSTE